MTAVGRQPAGTIEIDGQLYLLAKDDQGVPQWFPRSIQTQEGDPTVQARYRWSDWSRGMGDSRAAFRGSIAGCQYAFTGLPGRMLPGPKINIITGGHDVAITAFVSVTAPANRVISFGGRYAKEINPSTHVIATSNDFGVGATALDAYLFIDQVAIAMGETTLFQRRSAAGAYSANSLTGNLRYASCFGKSVEGDLVRGRSFYWSKCSAADFYGTDGNWSAEYDIGDRAGVITQVGAFQRWDYVLKEEGLYSFDQAQSKESNELPDLEAFKSTENKRWFSKQNRLFLCTYAGLIRYIQNGGARTVGVEEQEFNEATIQNVYPTAGLGFGKWFWSAWYLAATDTTYIVQGREARDGDATFGAPFTLVSVIDQFTGKCQAMTIPARVTSTPELWYARNTDIAWIDLTREGKPAVYQTANTTRVELSPNDLGSPMTMKYFRGWEIKGRNAAAARAIAIRAAMDEGAENAVGSVTSFTNGFAQVFWTKGTNDSGRVIQPVIQMTNDSTTMPPEVRELVLNYEERPLQVPGGVALLALRDGAREAGASTRKSAYEQRQAIEALVDGAVVNVTDPDGDTYAAAVQILDSAKFGSSTAEAFQFAGKPPQFDLAISVRRLDYS